MNHLIRVSEKHNVAVIPYDERVVNIIPHYETICRNDRLYMKVPSNKEELQLLKNLGYDTPNPMSLNYDWAGIVPFKAQVATAEMFIHSPRAYCLNDMGTGKTLSALFAYDYLWRQKLVRKMLVVAPLSTLNVVWVQEAFQRMPHLNVQTLWHSQADKRREFLRRDADIYVINHDGLGTIMVDLVAKTDIDVIIIDELAVFRNKQTTRWKNLKDVINCRKYVWGMTGSVTPMAPTDAWAQIRLLTPERTSSSFTAFRNKTMIQQHQFKWIAKPDANDTIFEQMQPSVRFTRDDCIDLPDTTYSYREVPLTPLQKKLYDAMMKDSYVAYLNGEISAANAGVTTSKLLQIASGFAYAKNDETIEIPATTRMGEVANIIKESRAKLLVFAPFKKSVDLLEEYLLDQKIDVAKVYGDTKKAERDRIFFAFQNTPDIKVIVANPKTMAHGLTLTAADTIVWFGPDPSLEIYEQANARITRPGQKHKTHIIHIEGSPIETKIYKRLTERGDTQSALLDMFSAMTKGSK